MYSSRITDIRNKTLAKTFKYTYLWKYRYTNTTKTKARVINGSAHYPDVSLSVDRVIWTVIGNMNGYSKMNWWSCETGRKLFKILLGEQKKSINTSIY